MTPSDADGKDVRPWLRPCRRQVTAQPAQHGRLATKLSSSHPYSTSWRWVAVLGPAGEGEPQASPGRRRQAAQAPHPHTAPGHSRADTLEPACTTRESTPEPSDIIKPQLSFPASRGGGPPGGPRAWRLRMMRASTALMAATMTMLMMVYTVMAVMGLLFTGMHWMRDRPSTMAGSAGALRSPGRHLQYCAPPAPHQHQMYCAAVAGAPQGRLARQHGPVECAGCGLPCLVTRPADAVWSCCAISGALQHRRAAVSWHIRSWGAYLVVEECSVHAHFGQGGRHSLSRRFDDREAPQVDHIRCGDQLQLVCHSLVPLEGQPAPSHGQVPPA